MTQGTSAMLVAAAEQILCEWDVGDTERAVILGAASIGQDKEQIERAQSVVFIYHITRSLIVEPPGLAAQWIRMPNKAFKGKTPLQVMLDERQGLEQLRTYLNAF